MHAIAVASCCHPYAHALQLFGVRLQPVASCAPGRISTREIGFSESTACTQILLQKVLDCLGRCCSPYRLCDEQIHLR